MRIYGVIQIKDRKSFSVCQILTSFGVINFYSGEVQCIFINVTKDDLEVEKSKLSVQKKHRELDSTFTTKCILNTSWDPWFL